MDHAAATDMARRADCAIDRIVTDEREFARKHRRPRTLNAREMFEAAKFEVLLVAVAAANVRNGEVLSDEDYSRLALAHRRLVALSEEGC